MTYVYAAVAVLSLEMQVVTWAGVADLRSVAVLNHGLLAAALVARRRVPPAGASGAPRRRTDAGAHRLPWAAVALLAAIVAALNVTLPLAAADPYHLERVDQIARFGTLQYDLAATPKVNVLGWTYELLLADLRQIPVAGPTLVRLHGVLGVALYVVALAAVRAWLSAGATWCWAAALAVPVVFHQFVLVKNDLFGAIPALVALAWAVTRVADARPAEAAWAGWLAGFGLAVKLTSAPVTLVLAASVLWRSPFGARSLAALAVGGLLGVAAGGVPFTLIENARAYGDAVAPLADAGGLDNRNTTAADASVGVARFALSLFDLGLVTRAWWPGRGGWGSTFGLPLMWALLVLAWRARDAPVARGALLMAGVYFLLFAAVYTDADLAHRLALAPGILLVAAAVHVMEGRDRASRVFARTLVAVLVLSAAQIARSAALYLSSGA